MSVNHGPATFFSCPAEAVNLIWYRAGRYFGNPAIPSIRDRCLQAPECPLRGQHSGLQASPRAALFLHAGVVFRPTITRGLALSTIYLKFFPRFIWSNFSAKRDREFQSFDFQRVARKLKSYRRRKSAPFCQSGPDIQLCCKTAG